jgi:hypothetical protein
MYGLGYNPYSTKNQKKSDFEILNGAKSDAHSRISPLSGWRRRFVDANRDAGNGKASDLIGKKKGKVNAELEDFIRLAGNGHAARIGRARVDFAVLNLDYNPEWRGQPGLSEAIIKVERAKIKANER